MLIQGPLSEELVFRSCMLATIQFGSRVVSKTRMIFTTPLYFGIAHLHHVLEAYAQGGKTPTALRRAYLTSCTWCS